MKVKKICAEDFRNIERAEVKFSDGINLLFGANAQGKTNLLEAICYFSLGKSFRGAKDAEFIAFDKKTAKLSLDFEDKVRERNLTIDFSKDSARKIEQHGMKISRMSEIIGLFRAVIFCPST